jgi:hypothetical protein
MAKKNNKTAAVLVQKFQNAELVSRIVTQFNKSDSFFDRYIQDTDKWYNIWRNLTTNPTNQYRSRVAVPVGHWTIETTVPRMVARPHEFNMTPRDTDNEQSVTHSVQAKQYYDYVLDQAQLKRKTRQLAKDMKIQGSGFWKYHWNPSKAEATLSVVPLRKLRIDPNVSEPANIQKCRYVIDVSKMTKDEILNHPIYSKNVTLEMFKKIDAGAASSNVRGGSTSNFDTTLHSKKVRLSSRDLLTNLNDPVETEYTVWEYFGYDKDGKRKVVVLLDKSWVIRDDFWDFDFWPFSMTVNTEDPDNILGVGDIEPVAALIEDINANRRLRTDNKNIRTNVMFERQKAAGIRDEDLKWTPGGIIDSNIPKGIDPIVIPDTTGGSLEEELLNYQVVEKATNTPPQIQGQLRASGPEAGGLLNRTATAFSGAKQETNIRFKHQSESLDRAVQETLRNLWKMISSTVTEDQVARVVGPDDATTFVNIPKEAIKKEYIIDIKFGSAAIEDDQVKREEALLKFQTISQSFGPEVAMVYLKDFLIAMGDKNIDETMGLAQKALQQAVENGNLPKPPQISVALGGEDMNSRISTEILDKYFPLSDLAKTPELFEDTRTLMFGQTPEKLEREKLELEKDKLKVELIRILADAEIRGSDVDNKTMELAERMLGDGNDTGDQEEKQ